MKRQRWRRLSEALANFPRRQSIRAFLDEQSENVQARFLGKSA